MVNRPAGLQKIEQSIKEKPRRAEQIHFPEKLSGSYGFKGGLMPSEKANRKSDNEHTVKEEMGAKIQVNGLE